MNNCGIQHEHDDISMTQYTVVIQILNILIRYNYILASPEQEGPFLKNLYFTNMPP